MKLYLTGGRQKSLGVDMEEWQRHDLALILEVDVDSGTITRRVEWSSPPEACPSEEPSILFKSASLRRDRLHVCTQTEVLTYALPGFERVGYVSIPCFNDVHHVIENERGNLVVANTGLDMVVELTPEGRVVQEWGVLGKDPWERFSREIDYRRVPTTKPHQSHPNFVFEVNRELWVTRFAQRDAISLSPPGRRIPIDIQRPHDGALLDGEIYFTTVDGHVVVADPETCRVVRTYDLNAIDQRRQVLGWCRGIYPVSRDVAVVGFSRIRPTKDSANVGWIERGIGKLRSLRSLPTHVVLFDLAASRPIWECELEKEEMNVVFGILRADGCPRDGHVTRAPQSTKPRPR